MEKLRFISVFWLGALIWKSCSFAPCTNLPKRCPTSMLYSSLVDNANGSEGPLMDAPSWKSEGALNGLLEATQRASIPCDAKSGEGAHDAFRYEWGRWIDDDAMEKLMQRLNEIQIAPGMCDVLFPQTYSGVSVASAERFRIAGGDYWDCILHVLPQGSEWRGRWPTGAWAVVRALSGVAEVAMLRGPNRDGFYTKATKKSLRGGGDGTLAGGTSGGGEDCVKYVGGAFRSYAGKSDKTTLLEIVVRPPVGKEQLDGDGRDSNEIEALESPERYLELTKPEQGTEMDKVVEPDLESTSNTLPDGPNHLGTKMGMTFEKVGGLDEQLNAIVRRVLASRANPEAARRLGVSHVRGVLLSGPPGCGKTLLARELSRMLGAREPQIVNGPEILDKFVGEAEKNIRALFAPAEIEYAQAGDQSALHVIILDEMDAIARKRGSASGDSTGVRDSVVNQLLAKMDGVKEANNVLVVGLTNRPELLDPALLRPGRLEVQLRIELPDLRGRRDILRIHTRRMKQAGGLSNEAQEILEDLGEGGLSARTEYFTGAELAGLVRSAASFALARTVESDETDTDVGIVSVEDLEVALGEVRPALGKEDEVLHMRYPKGISPFSSSMERLMRELNRFVTTSNSISKIKLAPKLDSMMLVGSADDGGSGVTALACWAAAQASARGDANYVRLVSSLDLLTSNARADEAGRAAALADKFAEAREMPNSLLILDDVDHIISGNGPYGYSSVMLATLRALLRSPPLSTRTSKEGGHSLGKKGASGFQKGRTLKVLAATSRKDAACIVLHELFDESLIVPQLSDRESVRKVVNDSLLVTGISAKNPNAMADLMSDRLGNAGCKTVLRILDRAIAAADFASDDYSTEESQLRALGSILDDFASDSAYTTGVCEVY